MQLSKNYFSLAAIIFLIALMTGYGCNRKTYSGDGTNIPNISKPGAELWITHGDQSALLQKQGEQTFLETVNNSFPTITIDSTAVMQTVDGFGFALTGGSAYVIHKLDATTRSNLLHELFGRGNNEIGISYLRISIGASDLDAAVFSYDDLPAGETDVNLSKFSLGHDTLDIIPILKEILAINPDIKILGSPWSPPVWMKDNQNSKGGSLLPQYYPVYANYFVKYIQQMRNHGITIDAITPQNEPLHPGNNPSLLMPATQEADFIKTALGPAFRSAGITTKIIVYDHNCDRPDYPLTILNDAEAKQYVDGSAFHLYAGDISALSQVHNAHPDKHVYFTEQWTGSNEAFDNNLLWHIKNVIIGSMRNWSRVALEWNLANDPSYNPHTPGGCTECKGALTIGSTIKRNPSYYIVAHASKFVTPGSVRIGSNITGNLSNVAFKTPEGKKVLIVENEGTSEQNFNIHYNNQWIATRLAGGTVGTYVW